MPSLGAHYLGDNRCRFVVWAPLLKELTLVMDKRKVIIPKSDNCCFDVTLENIPPGTTYMYKVDGELRPDPASDHQPDGVFGASCVVDHAAHAWNDNGFKGAPLEDWIIYELHTGTFTPEGTFDAAIEKLDALKTLGITTIELMPVAQFPGERNWGYDGVFPYAVQHSYGGPNGLKRLVDAAHRQGLSVILDVVYNHMGPEGNFLSRYMPFFTDKYQTPWGKAINYDDAHSDGVRNYIIQNALYWLKYYHLDGLRLDAIHGIYDFSAKHVLAELSEVVAELSRKSGHKRYLIAESDLNDRRVIMPRDQEGLGMDGQWSDDFHHSVHTLVTGERKGYYEDFGSVDHLVKALKDGCVYTGQYSRHRRRRHGNKLPADAAVKQVVCIQNHDQVGNRLKGERLSMLTDFESLKLAAAALLLSPFTPLLFMGEEYGEEAPFQYFMSFQDEKLIQAVREGRKQEFRSFGWDEEPPDPYAPSTFERSRLRWETRTQGWHQKLLSFYQALIAFRKSYQGFHEAKREVTIQDDCICISYALANKALKVLLNFAHEGRGIAQSGWQKVLDSSEERWGGPAVTSASIINPRSAAVYEINP